MIYMARMIDFTRGGILKAGRSNSGAGIQVGMFQKLETDILPAIAADSCTNNHADDLLTH